MTATLEKLAADAAAAWRITADPAAEAVGGATCQQLVLPRRHLGCQVPVGDGAVEPARKITVFQVVLQGLGVEMR